MAQETTPRRSDKFDFDKGRKSQKFDFSKENEKVETHAQARRGRTPLCVAAVAIAAVCAVTAAYSLRGGNSADEPAKQRAGLEASRNTTDRSQTAKADATSGQTAEPPSPAEGSTAAAGAKTVNMNTRPARTEDARQAITRPRRRPSDQRRPTSLRNMAETPGLLSHEPTRWNWQWRS